MALLKPLLQGVMDGAASLAATRLLVGPWPFDGYGFAFPITQDNCGAIGAPDYFDTVSRSMDLTTMQTNLEECLYDTIPKSVADFRLIVANAHAYTHPGQPVLVAFGGGQAAVAVPDGVEVGGWFSARYPGSPG